ncbi:hypothetical protein [Methanosarcina barkeri]|nr:hypothetical protein [Methanosarcina barkeri]
MTICDNKCLREISLLIDRVRARIVGLDDKEVYEKVMENALNYEEKDKEG